MSVIFCTIILCAGNVLKQTMGLLKPYERQYRISLHSVYNNFLNLAIDTKGSDLKASIDDITNNGTGLYCDLSEVPLNYITPKDDYPINITTPSTSYVFVTGDFNNSAKCTGFRNHQVLGFNLP